MDAKPPCLADGIARPGLAHSGPLAHVQLHERLLLVFHAYLFTRAALAPATPARASLAACTLAFFGITALAVALRACCDSSAATRTSAARSRTPVLLARAGIALPIVGEYLLLRQLLPALGVPLADASLLRLDEALFGATPAVWLEPHAAPWAVEWLAFFYAGYYALLGIHVVLALRVRPTRASGELLLGLTLVTTAGHALYTLVPGVGPVGYAGVELGAPLRGGYFFDFVQQAVAGAGAQLDIFPSLHTAHPLLIALHAVRHRREPAYRYTWPLVIVATAHMLLSTVFLRFHYGVDVLAGIALACTAHAIATAHAIPPPAPRSGRAHRAASRP